MKTTLIALGTAAFVGLGALAPVTSALAAPFAPVATAATVDSGLTTVSKKEGGGHRRHFKGHRGKHGHHGRHWVGPYHGHGGCYFKAFKVWDPYFGGYVIKKKKFCDHWRW